MKPQFYCTVIVKSMRGNHPVKEDKLSGTSEEVAALLLMKYSNPGTGGFPTKLAGALTDWYTTGAMNIEKMRDKKSSSLMNRQESISKTQDRDV